MREKLTLNSSVKLLDGVGQVVEKGLAQLNIFSIKDLLLYFPRRYDDFSNTVAIKDLKPGLVTIYAKVERIFFKKTFKKRLNIVEAILADNSGTVKATWFNQPYIRSSLKEGSEYFFAGKFEFKNNYLGLANPVFEENKKAKKTGRIVPVYPENKQINSNLIIKLIDQVIGLVGTLNDDLPSSIMQENQLVTFAQAIREIHQPTDALKLKQAKYRIAFGELFFMILASTYNKEQMSVQESFVIDYDLDLVKKFLATLHFELTQDQKRAVWQIFQDMSKNKPMNRLLNGDVGSGKTIVSFLACLMSANANYQSALMVPTEILAIQHYKLAKKLLSYFGVRIALLTSSLKTKEKKLISDLISKGEVDLIIGTHSLITDNISYKKLALVVIDEQHRFGVNQREKLKQKARLMPHLLSMSATPIPRTLAIIVYGDLDMSVIRELPPGRKPVITKLIEETDRKKTYQHIEKQIKKGNQVFVVCPLIGLDDFSGQKSVETEYQKLSQLVFSHRKIATLHGKMKSLEKSKIMKDFKNKKIDILIATSVIEVGVDIPDATIMLIEHSQKFGLASLHQLRGRVGRSSKQAYCYMFYESENEDTLTRLRSLEKSNDGFRLAQIDLQLRGPGDIYGHKQHGFDFSFSDLFESELIDTVKCSADSFLKEENMLKYGRVLKRLNQINTITSLD